VTVVDALGGECYAQQHLPGAIALVRDDVDNLVFSLLPDLAAAIVTYSSNPACPNGGRVADQLTAPATGMGRRWPPDRIRLIPSPGGATREASPLPGGRTSLRHTGSKWPARQSSYGSGANHAHRATCKPAVNDWYADEVAR
jgi:hypothetical protein